MISMKYLLLTQCVVLISVFPLWITDQFHAQIGAGEEVQLEVCGRERLYQFILLSSIVVEEPDLQALIWGR